jgi:uncharacterized membrane protein YozB (DUF420 family)
MLKLPPLIELLPHVNASLNALATALLVLGYVQIKRRQEAAHKWTMLACFGVSVVFLVCYLTHHWYLKYVLKLPYGSHLFPAEFPIARTIYLAILIPHVILAATVPFLALATIYLFGPGRQADGPSQVGQPDFSHLAVRVDQRSRRVRDAVPTLSPTLSRR